MAQTLIEYLEQSMQNGGNGRGFFASNVAIADLGKLSADVARTRGYSLEGYDSAVHLIRDRDGKRFIVELEKLQAVGLMRITFRQE